MSVRFAMAAIMAFVVTGIPSAFADQPLQASPISPGFWTWPREKAADAQAVGEACQGKVAIQFADGRYFGLKLRGGDKKALIAPVVDEVGLCKFDPATQTERCVLRINEDDGTVKTGVIESAFVVDADRAIRMTVTPKVVDGKPVTDPSFDVFPVQCPEPVVWSSLTGGPISK